MFTKLKTPLLKESGEMEMHENYKFQSKIPRNIPVVLEIFGKKKVPQCIDRFKFLVPYSMTVSQFIFIIRDKLDLSPNQDFHLLLKKGGIIVKMSQYLGNMSSNFKDKHGHLHFTLAAENIFGCPRPRIKPVRSKFPGNDPTPFGAPEPTVYYVSEQNSAVIDEENINWANLGFPEFYASNFFEAITQMTQEVQHLLPDYPAYEPYLPPSSFMLPSESGFSTTSQFQALLMHGLQQLQTSLFILVPTVLSLNQMAISLLPPVLLQMYPHYYVVIVKLNQLVPYSNLHITLVTNHVIEPISESSISPEHYIPLLDTLCQLAKEFELQVDHFVAIPNGEEPDPSLSSTHHHAPVDVVSHPSSSQMQTNSVGLLHGSFTPTPVQFYSSAASALRATHEFLRMLHQNLLSHYSSDMMVGISDASGPPVHPALSALMQYFSAVYRFLRNNQVLTVSNFADSDLNLEHLPIITLQSSLMQNWSDVYDSDEPITDEDDDDIDVEFG